MSDSAALRVPIRQPRPYRFLTFPLALLIVVVAPLAVIAAVATAVDDFLNGAVGGGVSMLVIAAVLAVVLLLPALFFWRRFLQRDKPVDLLVGASGFTLREGEAVLERLPWDKVTSVRLAPTTGDGRAHLVVSSPQPRKSARWIGSGPNVWLDSPVSQLEVRRELLAEALGRYGKAR